MVDLLNDQFAKLRMIIDEVYELKKTGQDLEPSRTAAALMFVALKHSNREVKRSIKAGRDELHLEKSKVDISRLQLQNLLYEVSHLRKEIVRCETFKSRDTQLELLSDDEYLSKFPDLNEEPDISDHKKHLKRLECELRLRKDLDNRYKTLLTEKEELVQDNINQTEKYSSFGPALRTLLDSTKPLHDALQLSLDVEWNLGTVVKYLPKELYLLFINLQALQRVNEEFPFSAEVIGFESDAQMQELLLAKENAASQAKNVANGTSRRRYQFREETQSSEDLAENVKIKELEPHPLHLQITIGSSDNSSKLVLKLWYWDSVKCVTVRAQICSSSNTNIQGEINFVNDLLGHLYPNDLGNEIPISDVQFELQKLGMTMDETMEFLIKNEYGRPYCWLQNMCSIPTVNQLKEYKQELNLQSCAREVIGRLRKRWHSWMELTQQIRGLTLKDVELYSLKENIYPSGLSCSLVQWTAITIEEFHNLNSDALDNMAEDDNLTYTSYRAVFVRGSAKMDCFIRIPSNYPLEMPHWIISVHWNGYHTSKNNSAIKMMELWTNSLLPKDLEPNHRFLYAQLFRTIYSFDIFLETEGSMQSTCEYNKEKPYISAFTKRIRLRPYRYIKKGSVYAFKQ